MTVPEPVPDLVTLRTRVSSAKVAVTAFAELNLTTHSLAPLTESQPIQTTALEPVSAVPFSVTVAPSVYSAEHSVPQSMPAGVLATVPLPLPPLVTERAFLPCTAKVAVTVFAAFSSTRHSFEPLTESQLPQTTALEPAFGAPFSVTVVP